MNCQTSKELSNALNKALLLTNKTQIQSMLCVLLYVKLKLLLTLKLRTLLVLLKDAIKKMDTAARKGLIHKNTASRQKARLTKKAL